MHKFLLLLVTWSALAVAQTPVPKVVSAHSEQRAVTATKTGLNYELLISLPENYAATQDRYPVLLVLDGWHFPLMQFLQNNNRFSRRMPPVIIVTISHGSGNVMAARARDFTPTRVASDASSGGADAFLDFLEQQLIPFIDQTYRTNPADRAILGHSHGGLFALYAMQQRPKLFQRVVASSPTIGWDNRKLFQPAKLKEFSPPVRLDLSVEGEPRFRDDVVAFANLLDEIKPNGMKYRMTVHKDENHNSVRIPALSAGLYWVYAQP